MKRIVLIVLLLSVSLWLFGCSARQQVDFDDQYAAVEHVGTPPEYLKPILKGNLFRDATAFEDRLLKIKLVDERLTVSTLDFQGKTLASYTCETGRAYSLRASTVTKDGGFLFVLGFEDYSMGDGVWASEKGVVSHVIKCDAAGNVQFHTPLPNVEGSGLSDCIEKNGKFYFFGDIQTPETKRLGTYSRTDVYMAVLDKNGKLLHSSSLVGSDFDWLRGVEENDGQFLLLVSSQSSDGAYTGSDSNGYPRDWLFWVNDDLEITEIKMESYENGHGAQIGVYQGAPVYATDDLVKNNNAGTVTAFVDYGDHYLVVSNNITGTYSPENIYMSALLYYRETVYSGYDREGNLIFRTSVDESPNYAVADTLTGIEKFFDSLLPTK